MDWESKFSSIVRETEANIAKVKHRLGTSRAATHLAMNGGTPHSSVLDNSLYGSDRYLQNYSALPPHGSSFSDPLRDQSLAGLSHISKTPSFTHNPDNSAPYHSSNNFSNTLSQSPAIVSLLQERLEVQNQTIENLTSLVKKQEHEKDQFQKQIRDLRGDLNVLNDRVLEKGIDLQTERKIEQWKRDMKAEMQLLQSQIQLTKSKEDSSLTNIQVAALVREVQDMKRFVKEEVEVFRRDLDSLKGRLVRLEIESTSVSAENKDLQRKHQRVEQSLKDLNNSHQSQKHHISKSLDDRDLDKIQLSELRNSMVSIKDKMNNIEQQMNSPRSGSELSAGRLHTDKKLSLPLTKSNIKTSVDLLSPTTSDIDISESTDLAEFNSSDLSYTPKYTKTSTNHGHILPGDVDLDLDELDLSDADSISFRELNLDDL